MSVFDRYAPFVQDFIYAHEWENLRGVQVAAGEAIFDTDDHVLLCASTASGKTEAAFFPILTEFWEDPPASVGALYIGPTKALINDQFYRLTDLCEEAGIDVWHWHGDVSASHKARLVKHPSGILQITPESLEALLMRRHAVVSKLFCDLRYVVIDEVHSLLRQDRGGQCLCLIERLARIAGVQPRRIGLSATIDMLNSEYAAMMKLARIGEILEDDALRDQALYRGARRLVPTIARMLFREYAAKNGLLLYPANVTIGVGFTELGFNFRNRGMKPMEVDLYDMSQGIPQDLVPLYRKYCPEAERNYFEKLVLPALFEKDGSYFSNPAMLDILSQASPISEPMLRKALEKCMEKTGKTYSYTSDWPGITVASSFGNVLYRLYGKVRIRTAKDLEIRDFVYDPAKKVVRLSCRAGESPELVLESSLAPVDSALLRDAEGRIRIPLRPGKEKNLILSFR